MFFSYLLFPIYLDYNSTTPTDPRVIEKILPYFYYKFGNYSSKTHIFGWASNYSVEFSRKKISKFLNCNSREIIWTSSSTESNNLCIKGFSLFYKNKGKNIITIKTEHKSILNCLNSLTCLGFNIIYLNLRLNGLINFSNFFKFLTLNTILLTISYVNNELGIIQNIFYISKYCKNNKIFFHLDASQSFCKIYLNLSFLKIDMVSISSHKIYAPKGISALYIRRKSNIYFKNIISGGGQEKNLRSGTLPTPLIVGFSESLFLKENFFFENLKIRNLKNIFFYEILKLDSIYLNGDFKYRVPSNINISFNFIEGESLIISMNNISVSSGSACTSETLESSHVLKSLNNIVNSSIRFVFGRFNNINNIYFVLKMIFKNIIKLRNFSPFI